MKNFQIKFHPAFIDEREIKLTKKIGDKK